jgi:hypothetical protein
MTCLDSGHSCQTRGTLPFLHLLAEYLFTYLFIYFISQGWQQKNKNKMKIKTYEYTPKFNQHFSKSWANIYRLGINEGTMYNK